MANTNLTVDMITNEALMILHQKCKFIGSINRQYDKSFAKTGAKIGASLRIREPNEFTVVSGAALSTSDITETSTTLTVDNQKHVDFTFSSEELTLDIDRFSDRYLKPAMSRLAAEMEKDAFTMYKDIPNVVDNTGSAFTSAKVMAGKKLLDEGLAPEDDERCLMAALQDEIDAVDAFKGLFQQSDNIGKQYASGEMGRAFGYTWKSSSLAPRHTNGSEDGAYLVNDTVASGDTTVTVDTGTGTLKQGDVLTFASVNAVHPETKTDLGYLKQFVVTADYAGGAGTISISPAITSTGAKQNVSALPADNAAITVVGTASDTQDVSLGFHKDAFTFATADLQMPQGVDFAARKVLDGISMRVVRDYTIADDEFPCRIDVLYGYKTIRPQLAVRYQNN